ncbi:hypothetical protein HYO05_23115 [Vibrio parahaemolyticus]|uniref:hypothetical protein n=1 Tax=Vibrio parahaemolyticus TaxID=670 RepID=UPI00084ABF1D|nr:hypothetical protein [Vibrio parahaemolyticus]EGQ8047241.1 hypothetical protein [Vibrio parahaemolyticus]EHH2867127.1 hypothetical protein [Vibrio parahaemolyticus]ELA9316685.1 hypothetical protein [Vibrio parahaemolyticus]MBM5036984.1 hypothetical protein [Vibrio parahaemolyticus]MBM5050657.1 hypothetical protein [Vibrio parahaemolyticus]
MGKNSLKSLASDGVEVLFDQILNDGLVKDIPIINTVANVMALGKSVRDTLFGRKLVKFLSSINSVSPNDYEKIKKFALSNESEEVCEKILNVIDSTSEISKADIIANVFLGYIEGELSSKELNTVLEVIERSYTQDLNNLLTKRLMTRSRKDMRKLQSNGIANFVSTPIIERKDTHPITTRPSTDLFKDNETYQESYMITRLGQRFRAAYKKGQRMREEHS